MSDRPREALVFGGGLDRKSGVPAVQANSFADLRNVHLGPGRMELRRGLNGSWDFGAGVAVLAVHPLAALGVGAAVTYDLDTRIVSLYIMLNDGSVASYVGDIWTLPEGAPTPAVIVADSYTVIAIAHDEATFVNRMVTRYYDVSTGLVDDLEADLDGDGTAAPIYFRGVFKHLNYLGGWGYGNEAPNGKDRSELVRVSLPGQPTVFEKNDYFLAGQRSDAVVCCSPVGEVLAVRKAAESYVIFGYDRTTFGIKPLDTEYGQVSARLSVAIKGRNYFWSLEGPRVSGAGPSEDLAFNLSLTDEQVDPLAITEDARLAFAVYVPDVREIWFVFGKWVFVLHIDEDKLRWSYNTFEFLLGCAGVLYSVEGASGGPEGEPEFLGSDFGPYHEGDYDNCVVTCSFDADEADLTGDETCELWLRSRFDGVGWYKATELFPVVPGINAFDALDIPQLLTFYDTAVRYRALGLYGDAYQGTPDLWPSVSRGQFITTIAKMNCVQTPGVSFAVPGTNGLTRKDATHVTQMFEPISERDVGSPGRPDYSSHPELRHRLQISTNYDPGDPSAATWTTVFDELYSVTPIEHVKPAALPGQQYDYRYGIYTMWDQSQNFNDISAQPILEGILYDFFDPGTAATSNVCDGTNSKVVLSLAGDSGQYDIGTFVTTVDTVIERSVLAGAFSEISRVTTSAAARPTSYEDNPAPENTTVHYRARWEPTAFGVTDIGPWRQVDVVTLNCP